MLAVLEFLQRNWPSWWQIFTIGGPFIGYAAVLLFSFGWLKRELGVRTAYTRKLFHFSIFLSAALVQFLGGSVWLCLFGGATSLVILIALLLGEGNVMYEAMARESDAPFRTYYIVMPYLATLVGGVLSNALFGDLAIIGYLVTGLGDAIGEPIGARFGRHRYRVRGRHGAIFTRSYEGSAAVLLVSGVASMLGLALVGLPPGGLTVGLGGVLGTSAALIEARAPHGCDNAPLLFIPTLLAWIILPLVAAS